MSSDSFVQRIDHSRERVFRALGSTAFDGLSNLDTPDHAISDETSDTAHHQVRWKGKSSVVWDRNGAEQEPGLLHPKGCLVGREPNELHSKLSGGPELCLEITWVPCK